MASRMYKQLSALVSMVSPATLNNDVRLASMQAIPKYQEGSKRYEKLMGDIKQHRIQVVSHPLFGEIHNLSQLRIFMENHVFAVYDFMSLVKNLQNRFTNVQSLWTPPKNRMAARFINEIVLGEESDEVRDSIYTSHYELYTAAMDQIKADTRPVSALINCLETKPNPNQALEAAKEAGASDHAIQFVKDTWNASNNPNKTDEEVAAYFLFGREDPIPDMFRSLLKQVPELHMKDDFVLYLERHIHLDEEQHGPMARRLLESLCKDDEKAWRLCTETAMIALESRKKLWDETLKQMKS